MANIPQKPVVNNQQWINGQTKLNSRNLTSGVNENITNLKTAVDGIIDALGGPGAEPPSTELLIPITYSDLVALRDSSSLVPGARYRITDYQCTTVQENTQSAGHQFDIIVEADSASTLNENAKAAIHDGDTYFASNNLAAWNLKYCIDNDTNRFAWADTTNGKGVIYWMKDEFDNECPYDFKNIQFKRKINLSNGYPKYDEENGTDTWVYTFTANSLNMSNNKWSELKDGSLESPYGHENDENTSTYHDNIIKPYIKLMDIDEEDHTKCGMQYLSDNVFLGYYQEVGSNEPRCVR